MNNPRFELKYLVPHHRAKDFLSRVAEVCEPDPHSGTEGYRVSSIYYDTPDFDCYFEKLDGVDPRYKIRARYYPSTLDQSPDSGEPVFLEIKRRIKEQSRKTRLRCTWADWQSEANQAPLDMSARLLGGAAGDEVSALIRRREFYPVCQVTYRRQALRSRIKPALRITMDTDLSASRWTSPAARERSFFLPGWRSLRSNFHGRCRRGCRRCAGSTGYNSAAIQNTARPSMPCTPRWPIAPSGSPSFSNIPLIQYTSVMKYHLITYGCQMNAADSEEMARPLKERGFVATADLDKADLVVMNTCTVREQAEHRAKSNLGRLKYWKKQDPNRILVVAGCAASRWGESIQKLYPFIDLVSPATRIEEFPEAVAKVLKERWNWEKETTGTFGDVGADRCPPGNGIH